MMLKVGNEFLEFNDLVEMEKQIKLIEEISTTDGDFSYAFELPKTIRNTYLLGNPQPDNISKPVYQKIEAQLLNNSGAQVQKGYLRIERVTKVYECSFFAGNNNWFSRITGLLSDLNLDSYDIEQTGANIQSSWTDTEGLVFPLVDTGPLLTRGYAQLKIEDFVAGFYLKTIFERIFIEAGIKVQGELFNDWMYNNIVAVKNSKSQEQIDARTSFVQKSVQQNIAGTPIGSFTELITWDNDSVYPYFDGSQNNFNLGSNRYTADVKMVVDVSVFFSLDVVSAAGGVRAKVYKNGVLFESLPITSLGTIDSFGGDSRVPLDAGDYIEIYVTLILVGGTEIEITGTVKITPTYIYKAYGRAAVPNWSQQQFVSNVLRLFNCLSAYDSNTNTLTINLFEKLKDKPAIDLSEYISETEVDYNEFISSYGQRSKLSYNEVDFPELKEYNQGKYFKYGQGVIEVNNDFIDNETDILESDFSNPVAYLSNVFDMSMERMNLIDLEEGDNLDFTAVSDSSGVARFAIPEDLYAVGDLVRISESLNTVYNGDWVVATVGAGWVEFTGLPYDTDTTGSMAKLDYVYSNEDDVFLVVNVPNYELYKFSGVPLFLLETDEITALSVGYFDIINTNKQINGDFLYSLSFGGIDDPAHYQITMTQRYFDLLGQVLNDPVKLFNVAHLPLHIYEQLDFLSPVTIKTLETTNRYYLNRITGYKESYLPCTLETIKLP